MQKINLICVGSIKEKYLKDALAEYQKRLGRFCNFSVVEISEEAKLETNQKIESESNSILKKCSGKIALFDRKGADFSSEDLAEFLKANQTEPVLNFVIGGSNGVSDQLFKKANTKIKFGNATFPHQLFRVLAAEQIYRAFTINAKMPYHK